MIETIETRSPNLIGLKVTDKLHEDYQAFVQTMETILTAGGKVRLFVQYEDLPGWDMYAAWDDFKLNLAHHSDFERIAVVGDRKWEKLMASFCLPFTKAQVKCFDRAEVDAAWKWLEENEDESRAAEEKDRTPDLADNSDNPAASRSRGVS